MHARSPLLFRSPRILLIALVRYTCDVFTTKISKNFRPVGISPFVTLHHLCEADSESPAPFSIPNAAIPNAATPSGQVKGSPIRASAALPFAKRDLDVMNKSDSSKNFTCVVSFTLSFLNDKPIIQLSFGYLHDHCRFTNCFMT